MENVEFLLLWKENEKSDDFPFFLVSCPWKFPRISPGQVQNNQLF